MYNFYKDRSTEGFISPGLDERTRDAGSFIDYVEGGSSVHSDLTEKIKAVPKTNQFFMFSVSFVGLIVFLYFFLYLFT